MRIPIRLFSRLLVWTCTMTSVVFSCSNNEKKGEYKTIDLRAFKIDIPKNWDTLNHQGIDSYACFIITNTHDTIAVSYGQYEGGFEDVPFLHPYSLKQRFDSLKESYPKGIVFSKNYMLDLNQATYLNEYYYYDTIDGYKVKMMLPKKIGRGKFGVYFDSLNSSRFKLKIVGNKVDSINHLSFYRTLTSIKILRK
jgi:hypothetical protein